VPESVRLLPDARHRLAIGYRSQGRLREAEAIQGEALTFCERLAAGTMETGPQSSWPGLIIAPKDDGPWIPRLFTAFR
jgi:Tetratricopeptide repeat